MGDIYIDCPSILGDERGQIETGEENGSVGSLRFCFGPNPGT